MKKVYLLQHNIPRGDYDNVKNIGIYESDDQAKEAIARLKNKPGFKDPVGEFTVGPYILNQDYWVDGFGEDD